MYRLDPNPIIYYHSGLNDMVANISKDMIVIGGGGVGPALSID